MSRWSANELLLFSRLVVSDSLRPHGLQHARLPCPSPTARACSNSCLEPAQTHVHHGSDAIQPSHPSVISFSSCLQSFPASGSFPILTSGGQSIEASASVFPMNIQGWFPLGLTGLISLQSKGLSRVFSNTTVQKHQFFGTQPSSWSSSHIHTWLLEKPHVWPDGSLSVMSLPFNMLSRLVTAFLLRSKHLLIS